MSPGGKYPSLSVCWAPMQKSPLGQAESPLSTKLMDTPLHGWALSSFKNQRCNFSKCPPSDYDLKTKKMTVVVGVVFTVVLATALLVDFSAQSSGRRTKPEKPTAPGFLLFPLTCSGLGV